MKCVDVIENNTISATLRDQSVGKLDRKADLTVSQTAMYKSEKSAKEILLNHASRLVESEIFQIEIMSTVRPDLSREQLISVC